MSDEKSEGRVRTEDTESRDATTEGRGPTEESDPDGRGPTGDPKGGT